MKMYALSTSLLLLLPAVSGLHFDLHQHGDHQHSHRAVGRVLPASTWYHERHPVHRLFSRDMTTDGGSYAQVGSPTWMAAYPSSTPDSSKLPQAWVDALNAAVASGSIPNIPPTSDPNDGNPVYPTGFDPMSDLVCSATYKCVNPNDTWNAPEGMFGTSFDDGPVDGTAKLLNFLAENELAATHFMIGVNILGYATQFQAAIDQGDDIAVHTWTHPHMTTLSNLDVVAQLGWTMQIIHDSTGGRVPRFWRPPYGDSDNRVRAIAKEIFGLHTIIWNQDTEDWSMASGGTTMQAINSSMQQWLTGPKNPGLIILEHELTNDTVQAFMDAYPVITSNGWKMESLARIVSPSGSAYWNADSTDSDTVSSMGILAAAQATDAADTGSPSTTSSPPAAQTAVVSTSGSSGSSKASAAPSPSASNSANAVLARPSSLVFVLGTLLWATLL